MTRIGPNGPPEKPSFVVPQIPPGFQAINLMRQGVGPEAIIQYEFVQGTQSPNKAYAKYTAEKSTETENIKANLNTLNCSQCWCIS